MMPGLGQVYQRRYAIAAAFFCIFTTANFVPQARLILPVLALLASFEAFRQERKDVPGPKTRLYVFCSVGMIGFLGWMSFAATAFLPVGNTLATHEQADRLAGEIRRCRQLLGRDPAGFFECPESGQAADPWGRAYRYQKTESGFEIRSAGPDGAFGNRDDYRFTYR